MTEQAKQAADDFDAATRFLQDKGYTLEDIALGYLAAAFAVASEPFAVNPDGFINAIDEAVIEYEKSLFLRPQGARC